MSWPEFLVVDLLAGVHLLAGQGLHAGGQGAQQLVSLPHVLGEQEEVGEEQEEQEEQEGDE